jgi:hypothetical protein
MGNSLATDYIHAVHTMKTFLALLAVIALITARVQAQDRPGSFELGLQLTGVHLHKIDETPFGIGARAVIDISKRIALDAEIDHYPENPSGNFGETAALVGVRSGWRVLDRFGVFAKARAGMMHFGGGFFDQRLVRRTVADIDVGGVLEYYPSPRTVVRVDIGDTILFYGGSALGTVHNFQPALGFGFRF